MKKLLALLMASVLLLTACGGGESCTEHVDADKDGKCDVCSSDVEVETTAGCTAHRDANDDGKCDSCEKAFDDGIEAKPEELVECTLTMISDKGETLASVAFALKNDKHEYALTSGADGSVQATVATGTYSVVIADDVLPEGFLLISNTVEVKADTTAIAISVMDNNPDGTQEKPFFVFEEEIALSIEAGAELYYIYRGAALRLLTIEHAGLAVVYQGNTVSAVDGVVSLTITPEMGAMQSFVVKNTTNAKIEATMTLVAPLGSMENPIVPEENSVSASVPAGDAVYYSWTADKTGVLLVTSENPLNNISLTNTATYAVSEMTMGGKGVYIAVSEGDVVHISVGSTDEDNAVVIDFALRCYTGSANDSIPVVAEQMDLSMAKGSTLYFIVEDAKTVTVTDEDAAISVLVNGETCALEDGKATFAPGAMGGFAVTNTLDGVNVVVISVQ